MYTGSPPNSIRCMQIKVCNFFVSILGVRGGWSVIRRSLGVCDESCEGPNVTWSARALLTYWQMVGDAEAIVSGVGVRDRGSWVGTWGKLEC